MLLGPVLLVQKFEGFLKMFVELSKDHFCANSVCGLSQICIQTAIEDQLGRVHMMHKIELLASWFIACCMEMLHYHLSPFIVQLIACIAHLLLLHLAETSASSRILQAVYSRLME